MCKSMDKPLDLLHKGTEIMKDDSVLQKVFISADINPMLLLNIHTTRNPTKRTSPV